MDKTMIVQAILATIQFCIGFYAAKWLSKKEKKQVVIYKTDHKHGWIDIRDNPIPHDIGEFLASDGEIVRSEYSVKYNHLGVPVMAWDKRPVKKWMPVPEP